MFSLACNLTKNDVKFFPVEISSKKGTCKQRGLFDHQNYIEKSTWKQQAFFDQQNYTEKSTWKRRGFFDNRNYFKKVRGNDADFLITKSHRKSTWKWHGNSPKFGLRRIDVISKWNRLDLTGVFVGKASQHSDIPTKLLRALLTYLATFST